MIRDLLVDSCMINKKRPQSDSCYLINTISLSVLYYLRTMIQNSKKKDLINLSYMKLTHNDSFFRVLKYIYTGKLILDNQEIDRIFDFFSIAKSLELQSLSEEMSVLLINSITLDNVASIYEKAYKSNESKLKTFCENLIDQNAEILASQKSLVKLPSNCLKDVISRDSFAIK